MEKNSAGSPLDQTIEQYKRDLMAVYRRSRTPVSPADQPPAPKPARPLSLIHISEPTRH